MNNKTYLFINNHIKKLKVEKNSRIVVHADLSRFGIVNRNLPSLVLKVLKNLVGKNGSIIMPAYTIGMPKDYIYNIKELAKKAIDLGFYISLSGIITFNKSNELRNIVKELPLNRLLVETDAPYLAPEPYRGKCNEPSYVVHTAKYLANIMNVDIDTVANKTTENFNKLFNKI